MYAHFIIFPVTDTIQLPTNGSDVIGPAVGGSIGGTVGVILIVGGLALFLYKRRHANPELPTIPTTSGMYRCKHVHVKGR